MIKNSPFWRTLYTAWDLACDRALPRCCRPDADSGKTELAFNALYGTIIWGALGGLLMLIAGRIFSAVLPVNGAALLFALVVLIVSESRTGWRGLALSATFFENIFGGKTFCNAIALRQDDLRNLAGVVPLLLVIFALLGKFFALFLAARAGFYGVVSAAWVIALAAEAVLAAEPAALGVPGYCRNARSEYIVALAGFFLLFNLISLPLATLIALGGSAFLTIVLMNLFLKRCGKIDSNDMTMTGYLLELAVLAIFALLIC
ncbi:MAG: hypothetical protein IKA65_03580 [Lentisphaeria bacterium]|nr:hypothetical protein [Lentisphaeria bacterium]